MQQASVVLRTPSVNNSGPPGVPRHLIRLVRLIHAEELPRVLQGREVDLAEQARELGRRAQRRADRDDLDWIISEVLRRNLLQRNLLWLRILRLCVLAGKPVARTDLQARYEERYPRWRGQRRVYVGEHLDQMVHDGYLRRTEMATHVAYEPTYYARLAAQESSESV